MKKITLLLAFAFSQFAVAQPVLNASDFPSSYSANGFDLNNITGFTNGPSGANVVWDYSSFVIPATPSFTYSIVPVSEANASLTFPDANFCEKRESASGTRYQLYILNDQSLEMIASISSFVANYYDPMTIFQFPCTYGSSFSDYNWQLGSPFPPEPETRTYDSYGTLILPTGTYYNVIRQKVDTRLGDYYEWYGTNPYRLLMIGNLDLNYAGILVGPELNNNAIVSPKMQLYPNPTSESFSITNAGSERLMVKIYDALGKQIKQTDDYISDTPISLKEFSSGIYIVKVDDVNNNNLFTEKIVKK